MEKITLQIEKLIGDYAYDSADKEINEYQAATAEFNEMVKAGLIKPRGNNLCLIQDSCSINNFEYNKGIEKSNFGEIR